MLADLASAVATGLGIGLAAGISPGPLLVLVLTSTLRGGARAGVLTAASPLLSDVLVVGVVLLTLGRLPVPALTWLGLVGGLVVAAMGVSTVREARTASLSPGAAEAPAGARLDLARGALVNLLSPHPWVTWVSILGPLTVAAWRAAPAAGVGLVVAFYLGLVGSKVVVALAVVRGRGRLTTRGYRRAVAWAGVALVAFGVLLAVEQVRLLA